MWCSCRSGASRLLSRLMICVFLYSSALTLGGSALSSITTPSPSVGGPPPRPNSGLKGSTPKTLAAALKSVKRRDDLSDTADLDSPKPWPTRSTRVTISHRSKPPSPAP
mmetsp:Transcript_17684/g.38400  ORF Transcript_17684/g.38400 Transcript_17684/m.38400 type:complete len:109 (-) Transcript_17684:194-520(-)